MRRPVRRRWGVSVSTTADTITLQCSKCCIRGDGESIFYILVLVQLRTMTDFYFLLSRFRALCALGTLLTLGDGFRRKMKGGVSGTLHFLSTKPEAQLANVKEVIQEIRDELR